MSSVIAVVKSVVGQVIALSPEGVQRLLIEGDRLFRGEQVQTGEAGRVSLQLHDGQTLDLGRTSQWLAADEPAQPATEEKASTPADEQLSEEELQQAIAAGMDPTAELAATAAGPGAGGSGGSGAGGIGGGHSFVMLDTTAAQVDVQVGFETQGLGFAIPAGEQDALIDNFTPTASIDAPPGGGELPPKIDNAPLAVADSFTVLEDGSVSGNLLANDSDADGDALSVTGVSLSLLPFISFPLGVPVNIPLIGTLQVDANGDFSFTPLANYSGPVPNFTYTISDGTSSSSATFSIDITPVNDAPTNALPEPQITAEDTPLTFSLLNQNALGAFDPDLDSLTTTLTVQHGVLNVGLNLLGATVSGDGTGTLVLTGSQAAINNALAQLQYTPNANYNGSDSLEIGTNDGQLTDSDSVAITVTPVNDAPVGVPEITSGPEGSVVSGNLLSNASDADGDALSVIGFRLAGSPLTVHPVGTPVTIPLVGSLLIGSDGAYSFIPLPDYNGSVPQVTYTLSDGTDSATSTLDILITPVNDAPTIHVPSAQSTPEDVGKIFSLATSNALGVFDVELDSLSVTLTVDNGVLNVGLNLLGATVSGDGTSTLVLTGNQAAINNAMAQLQYVPNTNYHGADTLNISATDGTDTSTDSVAITVTPVNDAPTTNDVSLQTDENIPVNGTVGGSDIDGDTLSFNISGTPSNGTVVLNTASGAFTYTPNNGHHGSDSFIVSVSDGNGGIVYSTVTIGIAPINDAPLGTDDSIRVAEGGIATTLAGGATSLLTNDIDPDNDPLEVVLVSGPSHGSLVLNSNGTFSYTHDGSETTSDSFTYRPNDGTEDGNLVTVNIQVTPVNDAPVSVADSISVAEGGTATVLASGGTSLLANDTDAEGNNLAAILVSGPSNGTLTLNANGTFSYVHNGSETSSDSFTYKANDGSADGNIVTVTIGVTPVNDAPAAIGDSFTVDEDGSVTINVLANDTDSDNPSLTITQVNGSNIAEGGSVAVSHGSVTLSGGQLVFTPDANYHGPAQFTYTASDGNLSSTATVNGTVTPVNDAPQATDLTVGSLQGGAPVAITLAGSDPDSGDALESFRITSLPDEGSLLINGVPVTVAAVAAGTAVISAADVAGGGLTYQPPAGFDSVNDGPAPTFSYQAFDGGAHSADATVTLNVADAAPVAVDDFTTLTEGSPATTVNLVIMLDTSTSMVDPTYGGVISLPGGGTTTRFALAKDAVENLISSYGDSLQSVMLVTFNGSATFQGWFSPDNAINTIQGLGTGNGTDFDSALQQVQANYGNPTDVDHTYVYFISDGHPATSLGIVSPSTSVSSSERADWVDFLENNDIDAAYAVGVGGDLTSDYAQSNLDTVAWSPNGNPPLNWNTDNGWFHDPGDFVEGGSSHNPNTIVVADPLDLEGVLQGTVPVFEGELLDGSISGSVADDFGADGAAAQKIVGVSLDSDGDGIGDLVASFDGSTYVLDLGADIGTLSIDATSGNYSFDPVSGFDIADDQRFDVLYTIEDADGSRDTATLHLTLKDGSEVAAYDNRDQAVVRQVTTTDSAPATVLANFSSTNMSSSGGAQWVFDTSGNAANSNVVSANPTTSQWQLTGTAGTATVSGGELVLTDSKTSSSDISATQVVTPTFSLAAGQTATISFEVDLDTDSSGNQFKAGDQFSWQLLNSLGSVVQSGVLTTSNGDSTISRTISSGASAETYRLVFSLLDNTLTASQNRTAEVRIDDIRLDITSTSSEQASTIDGNVITEANDDTSSSHAWGALDDLGDEGAILSAVNGIAFSGSTTISGSYGQLTIHDDGSYSYTPTADTAHQGRSDVFTYTLTQPDGDSSTAQLTIDIVASASSITPISGSGTFNGTANVDVLLGSSGADTINGLADNDHLESRGGSDLLRGGDGEDILIGGAGDDELWGGNNADTFVWHAGDTGADVIKDFNLSEDRIDLSDLLQGEENASDIGAYIQLDADGETLLISSTGNLQAGGSNADLNIQLEGLDLGSLGATPAAIINSLVAGAEPTVKLDQ